MAASSFTRLMVHRMATVAIPDGQGFKAGIDFFLDRDKRRQIGNEALEWTREAIALVRNAPDPNPWRDATDDDIAAEILRRVVLKGE